MRNAILYVDDEKGNLETFNRAFSADYFVKTCLSGREALELLKNEEFSLLIADQRMPGLSGIALCEQAIHINPHAIRMILTAYTETDLLLQAINNGHVHDYIVKPWKKSELKPVLDKAIEVFREREKKLQDLEKRSQEIGRLKEEIHTIMNVKGLIGASSGLREVMSTVQKVATTDSTVLLLGETGTGKEVLARVIHENSPRRDEPFIPLHCAALVKNLLESELFGHEKGAFTGAENTHLGRFELADKGSLFLDEVSEIPLETQVELLRVLQEKQIQRVGGEKTIPVDVRLIAASNKDLETMVKQGRFREDLFYRLNVIPIQIPPLRERKQDIPELARYFTNKFAAQLSNQRSLSPKAMELLERYDWPGNIRELQNILERAMILSEGAQIEPEDLNLHLEEMFKVDQVDLGKLQPTPTSSGSLRQEIQKDEVQRLGEALRAANGNISEAARSLGVARSTLFHRLKKYQLL